MSKPPAFQMYADNFLAGTADMSAEEVGIYIRLLCQQWSKGGLPNDSFRLTLMTRGKKKSVEHVMQKFTVSADGLLRNTRLEGERLKQDEYRAKQAVNGARGGRPIIKGYPNPTVLSGITQTLTQVEPKKSSSVCSLQSSSSVKTESTADKPPRAKFQPPSEDEAQAYGLKIGLIPHEVGKFLLHYGANGWRVGKNPMVNWGLAMCGWKTRWEEQGRPMGSAVRKIDPIYNL